MKKLSTLQKWRTSLLSPHFRTRNFRSDAALEAIAGATLDGVPAIALYNYPSFSGAFSALFTRLFHERVGIPCLVLPFSSFVPLRCSLLSFWPSSLKHARGSSRDFCYLFYVWPLGLRISSPGASKDFISSTSSDREDSRRGFRGYLRASKLIFSVQKRKKKLLAWWSWIWFLFNSNWCDCCWIRVIAFDHRKSALDNWPSEEVRPEKLKVHMNVENSSSVAVYEYFSAKLAEIEHSDVSEWKLCFAFLGCYLIGLAKMWKWVYIFFLFFSSLIFRQVY